MLRPWRRNLTERTISERLATFVADGEVILSGRETIYRNGTRCGWLSSAGYGHTLGRAIGMGYVRAQTPIDRDYVLSGQYELEVATKRIPAKVTLSPLYDPKTQKPKA